MSHHAGLPDIYKGWTSGLPDAYGSDAAYRDLPAMLSEEYATMPTRTSYSYNNLGFSLLGLLIERVSGNSYADYVQDEIL